MLYILVSQLLEFMNVCSELEDKTELIVYCAPLFYFFLKLILTCEISNCRSDIESFVLEYCIKMNIFFPCLQLLVL